MKTLDSKHILHRIIEAKQRRLQVSRLRVPEVIVRKMAQTAALPPLFENALNKLDGVRIIAELKKASPSKGILNANINVEELAAIYTAAGAAAVSVVTEEDFFQGDLGWIGRIRKSSHLPVLRKDFIFDPIQVYETRAAGASAILLISAMLRPDELRSLLALAHEVQLSALVEVHDEQELSEALEAGARIIGVNNRNLKTFDVDLQTSLRLAAMIPEDRFFVVESGIHSRKDIALLAEAGADAFLIGEHFITSADPSAAVRGLL